MTVEASFIVQLTAVGESHEARESTGHGVRLDGLPLEGHWSTIIIPVTKEQARALAGSIYRQVKLTIRIDSEGGPNEG